MYNETRMTIVGNVGKDPEVFDNQNGTQTVTLSVAVTARRYDSKEHTYVNGNTAWWSVRVYGTLAKNVLASVTKGTPVIVRGRVTPVVWTDKESGKQRSRLVLIADSVGVELATGQAQFTKTRREQPSAQPAPVNENAPQSAAPSEVPVDEFIDDGFETVWPTPDM